MSKRGESVRRSCGCVLFFFFQAEDGIRDYKVTGVQTCALPISGEALAQGAEQLYPEIPGNLCFDYEYGDEAGTDAAFARAAHVTRIALDSQRMVRSEERRVGKECRSRWSPYH